jgi:hypothetical protein
MRGIRGAALAALALAGAAAAQTFTTSAEVKPILAMTKSSWVALSASGGQDLLYFTHLESWRCGIAEIRFSVNSPAADTVRQTEPCYRDSAQPNALRLEGHVPYIAFPAGYVQSVAVELRFDDGTRDRIEVRRSEILMP